MLPDPGSVRHHQGLVALSSHGLWKRDAVSVWLFGLRGGHLGICSFVYIYISIYIYNI